MIQIHPHPPGVIVDYGNGQGAYYSDPHEGIARAVRSIRHIEPPPDLPQLTGQLDELATECEQRGRAKEASRLRLLAAIVNAAPDDQNIRNARNVIGETRRALHPERNP